jgi:hypothetical protein
MIQFLHYFTCSLLQLHTLRFQSQTRGHGTCPTTGKTHQLQAPQAHFCVFFRRQFRRRHGVVILPLGNNNKWDGMYHMRWMRARLERLDLKRVRQLMFVSCATVIRVLEAAGAIWR